MVDKSLMKIIYYIKCNDRSSQKENKLILISFMKILVYRNYLYVKTNFLYWLIHVMQRKNLTKLDKVVHNLSEKEHENSMEMLKREKLLYGSKGNVHKVLFQFLLNNGFLNINCSHVLSPQFLIFSMFCKE